MFPRTMDPDRCCETVSTPGMLMSYHQCTKKVTVIEDDGKKHCKTHSYAEVARRRSKADAKYRCEREERQFQTECIAAVMRYAGCTPQLVKFLHDYTFKQAILGEKGAITIMAALERAKRMYAISKRVRV